MKFLVIRFSSLGDIILLTGFIKKLKESFPGSQIHILTKDIYADIFRVSDYADKIIEFPAKGSFTDLIKSAIILRKEDYSIILDMHNQIRSKILRLCFPFKTKYTVKKSSFKKSALIFSKKDLNIKPLINEYFDLLSEVTGKIINIEEPVIFPSSKDISNIDKFLSAYNLDKFIIIHPGAKWKSKQWPGHNYIKLINLITKKYPNIKIVLTGSALEEPLTKLIQSKTDNSISTAGFFNIRELSYLMSRSKLLISGDTAATHIARIHKLPQIILLGATVKEFGYIPSYDKVKVIEKDLECRPCSRNGSKKCKYDTYECLKSIKSEEVLREITDIIGE